MKRATCARAYDEECPICQYGFALKDKIDAKEEKGKKMSKRERESWRSFMQSTSYYVNAVKVGEGKNKTKESKAEIAGPQQCINPDVFNTQVTQDNRSG